MKPVGRSPKPLTERELEAVLLYLNSDLSLNEVGQKYGMSYTGIRYKVKKFRKEEESKNAKENK